MRLNKISDDDAEKLRSWWRWLDENRGDRAQMRRASKPEEALLNSAFSRFLQTMPKCWHEGKTGRGVSLSMYEIALVAATIARVKSESSKSNSFAKTLAAPKQTGGKAVMSELRFQQLQKSRTPDDFFTRICRAINLLGGDVNIASLADDIVHWLMEYKYGPASQPQNRLAVRWASDYYMTFKD